MIRNLSMVSVPALIGLALIAVPIQAGPLLGTVPLQPSNVFFAGFVPIGTPAGSLLESMIAPFSFTTTAGTTSGTVTSAVYRNLTGTLDFYYQVSNSPSSATALVRETMTNFEGFQVFAGYRVEALGPFAAGNSPNFQLVVGQDATGAVVDFALFPVLSPGQTTQVWILSTNALTFGPGNVSLIDGGSQTVASYGPVGDPVPTSGVVGAVSESPEPGTLALIAGGLLALIVLGRRRLTCCRCKTGCWNTSGSR